jgi:type IV secretory pathway VirB10-like protein
MYSNDFYKKLNVTDNLNLANLCLGLDFKFAFFNRLKPKPAKLWIRPTVKISCTVIIFFFSGVNGVLEGTPVKNISKVGKKKNQTAADSPALNTNNEAAVGAKVVENGLKSTKQKQKKPKMEQKKDQQDQNKLKKKKQEVKKQQERKEEQKSEEQMQPPAHQQKEEQRQVEKEPQEQQSEPQPQQQKDGEEIQQRKKSITPVRIRWGLKSTCPTCLQSEYESKPNKKKLKTFLS